MDEPTPREQALAALQRSQSEPVAAREVAAIGRAQAWALLDVADAIRGLYPRLEALERS